MIFTDKEIVQEMCAVRRIKKERQESKGSCLF